MSSQELGHNQDIDAVIAWVDGSDPKFQKKLLSSLKHLNYKGNPEEYSPDRFATHYDIFTCVLLHVKVFEFVIFDVGASYQPGIT